MEKILKLKQHNKKYRRILFWGQFLSWLVCIYSTLYIVRPICNFLKANTPFPVVINLFMISCLMIIIFLFIKTIKYLNKKHILFFFIILIFYGFNLWNIQHPEEKIHFVQYGLLAFLALQAFKVDFNPTLSYVLSFLLCSLAGWGDEGIQYLLPNRYYQLSDVFLNIKSVLLGLGLTFVIRKKNIKAL